jgi:hypothetical protein
METASGGASRIVWNPIAKIERKAMTLPEKAWINELTAMLDQLDPRGCPRVKFLLEHPNKLVSMVIEVLDNLFVVQQVQRGIPEDN